MSEHTPGPWTFDGRAYISGKSIGSSKMIEQWHTVAQVRGWGHLQYRGEEEAIAIQTANGHLIAAAPELLAMLEDSVLLLQNGDFTNGVTDPTGTVDEGRVKSYDMIQNILAVIAKAKGEAS